MIIYNFKSYSECVSLLIQSDNSCRFSVSFLWCDWKSCVLSASPHTAALTSTVRTAAPSAGHVCNWRLTHPITCQPELDAVETGSIKINMELSKETYADLHFDGRCALQQALWTGRPLLTSSVLTMIVWFMSYNGLFMIFLSPGTHLISFFFLIDDIKAQNWSS